MQGTGNMLEIVVTFTLGCGALLALLLTFRTWTKPHGWYRRDLSQATPMAFGVRKPSWVTREVIRLKVLMAHDGCRKISDTFNRLYAHDRKMTVGKSFVANVLREHQYEIAVLRRKIKHRVPSPVTRNVIWQMDLTGKATADGKQNNFLGIIDFGSRVLLTISALPRKTSVRILITLLEAIERYGTPKVISTDNEATFNSTLFRAVLFLLGIRHRKTDPHCPWQNGRIERLFGTLKQRLDLISVDSAEALSELLRDFRVWYNFVRPHQHLHGRTPAETWNGVDPFIAAPKQRIFFSAWDGLLAGYYLRR